MWMAPGVLGRVKLTLSLLNGCNVKKRQWDAHFFQNIFREMGYLIVCCSKLTRTSISSSSVDIWAGDLYNAMKLQRKEVVH